MYLVDTHTHIFLEEFDSDIDEVILRAEDAGVKKFCLPNIDTESINRLHQLSDTYPSVCFPMMGLHPTSVNLNFEKELETILSQFEKRRYIAIGEIGIDLYWDKTYLKEQKIVFEKQLKWSLEMNLPVAIHTRDAFSEVFDSIYKVGADRLRGVFHSFGGSREELEEIVRLENFLVGINGVVTYKNASFRDYLPLISSDRVLLETDAPYLSPVPFRGKRNEPAYIVNVAERLAEIYSISVEEIAGKTTRNALGLFSLTVQG
jgi:hydrolase, TatD family